jgi:class 3 adenylate cyclase/tetratricopeptide (TPR) repeat protein
MTARAQTVTILFTDLVGSTELLQRAGDERAQRIFKAHHRLLREAVEAHGGHEVKWLGDGLMVAFDSTADAVKCAIAMQQASRRPTAGERLEIRAGLNVGEAFVDESDYFGTSVVIARRLCDSGGAGQIRASDIVVRLLDGRGDGIRTKDLGQLDLKGITNPVPAVEILYDHDPMALLRRLPFVGREAEYETMLKRLADARNGRGSVILLAGEPGIGKTRLTEEFCDHASSGATVIRGNCYEGDVAAPVGPWTEALRSLLEQTPDAELRDTLGPGAPDIAAMLPEVRRRIPDLEEAPRLEPEAERARLFDSVNAWLRNTAERRPLVIFFDDLHWCDRPSLALAEQVARGVANQRIVIVGTYRDVEVDRVHPLAQTLGALRRMEHQERIALKGFSGASVLGLLNAIEPDEATEPARRVLAQALHDECEGNPFFIREVLNNLVETAKLTQRDGVWVGTVGSIEELGIPEGIKDVIGRRLSRLSETCNRMLQRASAMTGGFTWDELNAICDDSDEDLLDALDEALGSQLIAERERNAYAFTHALIRATLYDELSTPRRVQLHRRIGESLETLYADRLDDYLGELAAHFMLSSGGDAHKAIDYSVRAGARAMSSFAWEEAARHYQRALQSMEDAPGQDHMRCRVLLSLEDVLVKAGDRTGAAAASTKALECARRSGTPGLFVEAALAVAERTSELTTSSPALVSLLEETLAVLDGLDDDVLRTYTLLSLSRELHYSSQFERSKELGRQAVATATRSGDKSTLARALQGQMFAPATPGDVRTHLNDVSESLAIVRELKDTGAIASAEWQRAADLFVLGDIAAASEALETSTRLGGEIRDRPLTWTNRMRGAALVLFRGELELAEQLARDTIREARDFRSLPMFIVFGCIIFLSRRDTGRMAELEAGQRALVTRFPDVVAYRAASALMYAEMEWVTEARADFDICAEDDFSRVPRDENWLGAIAELAEVCFFLDDATRADILYKLLAGSADLNVPVAYYVGMGSASRQLGLLSATLGRVDEAARHFEDAVAMNVRMGAWPWVARTRLSYGAVLLRRNGPGDRERAVSLLQQAHDFAKESGMAKVERESARLLASLS